MSSIQEQYAEAMRTSQEAVVGAVESWTKSVQKTFGQTPAIPEASVDPNQVIDQVFDFAEKMLEVQREFAKNLASTSTALGGALREQAESAGQAVRQQAEYAGDAVRQQTGSVVGSAQRQSAERYDDLTKAELQDELGRRDLPKSGTVEELRQRLRDADK